jgi:protein arginine kinase
VKRAAVSATALGLSRNEDGRRFPHAEDPAILEDLRSEVMDVLIGGQWEQPWRAYELQALTDVEIEHLVERGLMTPGFAEGTGEGRGFAVYGEGQASLEVNGVDHLRVLGFRDGDQLDSLWSLLNSVDDRLETVLSFAFDPRWGYLSARPRQSGSGMRAYATLAVPALMLTGRLAGVAVELVGQGLGISPLWSGAGGVVQVSNVSLQGKPETEILAQVSEVCAGIVERERSVRKMLLRENPIQTRDQIGRSLGTAQQAWSVSFLEAVNLVSAIQAGRELRLVEGSGLATESAFGLMTRLQSAHILVDYMDGTTGCLESPEIEEQRAQIMREMFGDSSVRPQERRDV